MPHKKRNRNYLALFGFLAVFLVSSIALFAVMFMQKQIAQVDFDTRKAAMVDSGLAELTTYPFNQSTLKVKEEQKIKLQINTKTKTIKQVELIFEIIADKGLFDKNQIKFTGTLPAAFKISKQEITESLCEKNCFTAHLLLELKDPAQAFSTHDQMQTLAELSFTPQKEGSVKVKISQDSEVLQQDNAADILQKPSVLDFQYYVTANGVDRAQCYYDYTAWSDCDNGWQTRKYTVQPDKCYWYEKETLEELSRKCSDKKTINADNRYFYLYSNDRCLNQPSNGASLYIIWSEDQYEDVSYIDVSNSPNFNDFYHKKVSGNIDQRQDEWLMVNAKDFTHATGNKGPLSFEPNTEYFFRLYSTKKGGQHISAARYYITYCSGDQSKYKNCNDACDQASDQSKKCAPGLICYEGACRQQSNPTNQLCLATPGIKSRDLSCNQYCASNTDCAAGLTCFWNRCRSFNNLESTTCDVTVTKNKEVTTNVGNTRINSTFTDAAGKIVLLPSEAYDLTTYSCNQGCNNNRDCNAGLRCYRGSCRLADNPESATCIINSAEPSNASQSSSINTASTNSAQLTTTKKTESASAESNQEQASFATNLWRNLMTNFSWQWLAVIGAILLFALFLMTLAILQAKKNPWQSDSVNKQAATTKTENDNQSSEKIDIPKNTPLQF